MRKALALITIITFSIFTPSKAQYFTDIQAKVKKAIHCAGSWIDHDDDGDLDLILTGEYMESNQTIRSSQLYRNIDRETVFSYVRTSLTDVSYSATDVADYDNDGDLDVVLTGLDNQGKPVTQLYRNDRNNKFTLIQAGLKDLYRGDVAFADFDRDGNKDIAVSGKDSNKNYHTIIYRGDGKGGFSVINKDITGIIDGELAWGDYDNDGDYDLFLCGENSGEQAVSELYEFKNNNFRKLALNMPGRKKAAAAWGDYDNDGDKDLVLTGEDNQNRITIRLLNNIGNGNFLQITPSVKGTRSGSVDWGDYDHDGDIDILITGETSGNQIISKIYRNNRRNNFNDINAGLVGVYFSDAAWGDYDNDGDLDLFLSGLTKDYKADARIYRNERIEKEEDNTTVEFEGLPSNKDIWNSKRLPSGRRYTYYYFLISSCFCRPDSTYQEKGYHVFISEAFKIELPSYRQQAFFNEIIANNENWGEIKAAFPSQGYTTMSEARRGRQQYIESYRNQRYKIHFVPWNRRETYLQR